MSFSLKPRPPPPGRMRRWAATYFPPGCVGGWSGRAEESRSARGVRKCFVTGSQRQDWGSDGSDNAKLSQFFVAGGRPDPAKKKARFG